MYIAILQEKSVELRDNYIVTCKSASCENIVVFRQRIEDFFFFFLQNINRLVQDIV